MRLRNTAVTVVAFVTILVALTLNTTSAFEVDLVAKSERIITSEVKGLGLPDSHAILVKSEKLGKPVFDTMVISRLGNQGGDQVVERSVGCSTGCSTGCSVGCSVVCSVGCR